MTEYRFDWQAQGSAAGRSFESWLIPTLVSGEDFDAKHEALHAATGGWADVNVTVQINGIEVDPRGFFTSINDNLTYLIKNEAKQLVENDERLTEIATAAALFQEDCVRAVRNRLGRLGIAQDEEH